MRRLYLDIDGTVNSYQVDSTGEEIIKPRLSNGVLQRLLEKRLFDEVVIVSGWATMIRDAAFLKSRQEAPMHFLVERIREVISGAFPDAALFRKRCVLEFENDNRAAKIDLKSDWYFIDDWATEYFTKAWGPEKTMRYIDERILMCDPWGDGSDIVEFIGRISELK